MNTIIIIAAIIVTVLVIAAFVAMGSGRGNRGYTNHRTARYSK